jgi:ABC-2 type transport system permease protein
MTQMTALAQAPARVSSLPAIPVPAGFGGAVRSEWTKIRTVRSTFWTLIATMAVTIGLSTLLAWGNANHDTVAQLKTQDLALNSMNGLLLGQLVIVVFGALAITAEYSTGMIRTSFTSMPRRGVVYAAKGLVATAVALVVGLVSSFASFFLGSAFFNSKGAHIALSDPHVLRAVVGGGLYLAASALFAFGLGAIIRHSAGAITASVGLLFVLSIMSNFLPGAWKDSIGKWIPFNAGMQVFTTQNTAHMFTAWTGFFVYLAYAVAAVAVGGYLVRKRDA